MTFALEARTPADLQRIMAKREGREVITTNSVGMKFAFIPKGQFVMGTPPNEPGRYENEAQHTVTLTHSFAMETMPVTQHQYLLVMGKNPSHFDDWGSSRREPNPVEKVSWDDAVAFCKKLSEKEHVHYRLPTEAEWEYACRAGSTTMFFFGDKEELTGEYAWFKDNSDDITHPVGQKKPNAWGLYDMHGNVWQWCSDWFDAYPLHPVTDPVGPFDGKLRILRGGSWDYEPTSLRSGYRGRNGQSARYFNVGFRVVQDLN